MQTTYRLLFLYFFFCLTDRLSVGSCSLFVKIINHKNQ